jgi:hypothetical protein
MFKWVLRMVYYCILRNANHYRIFERALQRIYYYVIVNTKLSWNTLLLYEYYEGYNIIL